MAQEANIPPNVFEQIDQRIQQRVQEGVASILRSATISGGAGLSIKDGGVLRLVTADGVELFYIGPLGPEFPDGRPQQGWAVRRADGTGVLDLMDIDVSDGVARQALNWRDRAGNVVLADDTDSGQGVARPWVPFVAYPTANADWPTTGSTSFVTLQRSRGPKQQPRLYVEVWANAPDAGAVAEVQVLVNNTPLGPAQSSTPGFVTGLNFGPLAVAGAHMSTLNIEIQARLKSGTGVVQLGVGRIEGRQT